MININQKVNQPISSNDLIKLNNKIAEPMKRNNILNINGIYNDQAQAKPYNVQVKSNEAQVKIKKTNIDNKITKGQKVSINKNQITHDLLKLLIGWNILDSRCDLDLSAFVLSKGSVLDENWFVFYGNTNSPDNAINYCDGDNITSNKILKVDFKKLDNRIDKIALVITIDEALTKNLNFSMVNETFVQLYDDTNNKPILEFELTDYYDTVTSMVVGEIYKYKEEWKFRAVGDGVAKDLAGICAMYGIETE